MWDHILDLCSLTLVDDCFCLTKTNVHPLSAVPPNLASPGVLAKNINARALPLPSGWGILQEDTPQVQIIPKFGD